MKLIFGSTALKHWFPDFERSPKDLDYLSKEGKSTKEVEYHWADGFQYVFDNNKDSTYVDPDYLYTIKVSHAAWDIRWDKTMNDIIFLKNKGCNLDPYLYKLLLDDWEKIHSGKKHIKVAGKPEDFFKPTVSRKMDHEDLHQIVKFFDKPMHEMIRKDKNNVKPSKKLWDVLSYENKLNCALEETYVFALERYLEYPPKIAFEKALKHLITKSTRGYFNLFMIENFETLLKSDKTDFKRYYERVRNEQKLSS